MKAADIIEHLCIQFAYPVNVGGVHMLSTGALSALEAAFEYLGWPDPRPFPELGCDVPGCGEHASCGWPSKTGYRRTCGKHYQEQA